MSRPRHEEVDGKGNQGLRQGVRRRREPPREGGRGPRLRRIGGGEGHADPESEAREGGPARDRDGGAGSEEGVLGMGQAHIRRRDSPLRGGVGARSARDRGGREAVTTPSPSGMTCIMAGAKLTRANLQARVISVAAALILSAPFLGTNLVVFLFAF